MSGSETRQRRKVLYRGRVQGVGFRYRTVAIARRFDIEGYVRNLPDGGVEVVVEGGARELDCFLEDIAAAMSHYIRDIHVDKRAATGEFAGFEVRY